MAATIHRTTENGELVTIKSNTAHLAVRAGVIRVEISSAAWDVAVTWTTEDLQRKGNSGETLRAYLEHSRLSALLGAAARAIPHPQGTFGVDVEMRAGRGRWDRTMLFATTRTTTDDGGVLLTIDIPWDRLPLAKGAWKTLDTASREKMVTDLWTATLDKRAAEADAWIDAGCPMPK